MNNSQPLRNVYFDARWIGPHGIGRFASEVASRIDMQVADLHGSPSSPLDTVTMWLYQRRLPAGSLIFTPGYNVPLFVSRPYIVTIHDLNHIDRPENSSILKRLYYRFILRRAVHNSTRVITVSEFSKQRIVDWSGIAPEKIAVVGNGVATQYNAEVDAWCPGFDYLLCVSNRKGHKNEVRLLEALAQSGVTSTKKLLFTGEATESLSHKIKQLGLDDKVQFIGRIDDADLPGLYKGATALLFPSLYEGFGLPVLEAMACGTPVLTSNGTALTEVAGDAALLVDPYSVRDMATAIDRICNDALLREELSSKGIARARHYTWDDVASRVKQALDEVLQEVAA